MLPTMIFTLFAVSPFLFVQALSNATSTTVALPTSLGNVPSCVLNCTATAATQAGCTGAADLPCVCTSQKFQVAAAACLQAQCSASDQAVANELHNSSCAGVSSTRSTGSSTALGSASTSSSSIAPAANSQSVTPTASTSATSGSGSSTSGATSDLNMRLGTGYIIGFVAVLAGIITGTLP